MNVKDKKNYVSESTVQKVGNGKNTFLMRFTRIEFNSNSVFERITRLITDKVIEIIDEGIYVSTLELHSKLNYISLEIYTYEDYIEVITSIITY